MKNYTDEDGLVWKPYSIEYRADDKTFSTTVFALSFDHARLVLDDLKETAKVTGRIEAIHG